MARRCPAIFALVPISETYEVSNESWVFIYFKQNFSILCLDTENVTPQFPVVNFVLFF